MTLGLEDFLKELRATQGVAVVQFSFWECKDTKYQMLKLDVCVGDRVTEQNWLEYRLCSDPLDFQKKFPKSFASILKEIKKEIKKRDQKNGYS